MKMARIIDGVVGDVIVPIEGFRIEECFHPDLLAQYITVADDVQSGWIVTEDGIVAPEPEAPAEEAPAEEAPEATV
jgi:hypothetical protein